MKTKSVFILAIAMLFNWSAIAQLNMASTESLKQSSQGTLQVLGKSDFNVDEYFTPYESIKFTTQLYSFNYAHNSVGAKFYVTSEEDDLLFPCVDYKNQTYTLTTLPEGYYEITRIIRFEEQLTQILNNLGYVSERQPSKDNLSRGETESILDTNTKSSQYTLIPNDSIYEDTKYCLDEWVYTMYERLPSQSQFEREMLLEGGSISRYNEPIYEITNDKNESFYIRKRDGYDVFHIDIRRASYQITQKVRRNKIIRTDTIKTICYKYGRESKYYFGDINDISHISLEFYNQLCADMKGKEVLLILSKDFFEDAITGNILKNPGLTSPESNYYKDKHWMREIVGEEHGQYKVSFPELPYVKCIDIMVHEGCIYGLFQHNDARFYIGIGGFHTGDPVRNPDYGTAYLEKMYSNSYCYYKTPCYSYGDINFFPKAFIEETRQQIDTTLKEWIAADKLGEQERKEKRKKEEEEYEKEKQRYRAELIALYGETYGNLIADRKVTIGMTEEMCREAWGRPHDKYNTTTTWGTSSVWVYNYKTSLYFYDGVLKQIEN